MELKKLFNHAPIVPLRQLRGGISLVCSIHKLLLLIITLLFSTSAIHSQENKEIDISNVWSSDIYPTTGSYNVTLLGRSFKADTWDVICLPFDTDESQLNTLLGEDFKLCEPTGFENNTFIFTSLTKKDIVAGKSYLIKSVNEVNNPVFNNVKFKGINWDGEENYISGNCKFIGIIYTHNSSDVIKEGRTSYIVNANGTLKTTTNIGSKLNATYGYFCIEESNYTEPLSISIDGNVMTEDPSTGEDTPPSSYTQLTNLPAVYIDEVTMGGIPVDLNHIDNYPNNAKTEEYYDAKITIVNPNGIGDVMEMSQEAVTIRGRGNSTWGSYKKPYRLKFPKKKKMLGENFANAKSWTLIANAFDKSMIRNAITHDLGKFMDMPFCPAAQFVDLYICGEYRGTYQISDHVQVASKRVPVDEDTGWFFEAVTEDNAKEEPYYQVNGGPYLNIKNPEDENLTGELEAIQAYCNKAYGDVTKDAEYTEYYVPATGYRKYWEEKDLVDYYVASELIGNYDAFISVYAYKENENDKLHMGPLWDQDIAYGNNSEFIGNADNMNKFVKDWGKNKIFMYQTFMKDARFAEQANIRWKEIYNKGIVNTLTDRIDELADIINESQQKNYEICTNHNYQWAGTIPAWKIDEADYACNFSGALHSTYAEYINDLKDYVTRRAEALNTLFEENYENVWKNQGNMTYDITDNKNLYDYRNKAYTTTMSGRTFNGGEWNMICLPFDMTPSRLKSVFGEDYVLREFSGAENNIIRFTEPKNNEITGGVPYLIKVGTTKTGNINFGLEAVNTYQNSAVETVAYEGYTFKGLITPESITKGYIIAADGSRLEDITAQSLNGSFAYITLPEGTDAGNVFIYIDGYSEEPQPESLTFDATASEEKIKSLLASQTGVTTDVQITGRTLKSTQWNPFALPFDLTKEQMTEALGEGYSLQESSETNGLSMMFTEKQDGLAAGVPYLIKPSADVADPTFKNVTIKEFKDEKVGNDAFKFVAAIAGHQWKTDKSEVFYLLGRLYYPNAGTVALQGTRAYFELPKNETAAKFSIMIDDGTTTSIVTIEADNGTNHSSKIYNLNGQLLDSDIEKLPKGIYIINGRKTVIK